MNKRMCGNTGETLALDWLENLGYVFVDRNHFTPFGEIDLVVSKDFKLYFVEVKFRRSERYGTLRETITSQKYISMKKSAIHYLKTNQVYHSYKISFLGILVKNNETVYDFIENVFE